MEGGQRVPLIRCCRALGPFCSFGIVETLLLPLALSALRLLILFQLSQQNRVEAFKAMLSVPGLGMGLQRCL